MSIRDHFKIKYLLVACALLIMGFFLLNYQGFSWYNSDWSTYGVNLLARMGEYENYFLTDGVRDAITPQIVTDYIVIFFMGIGLSYRATLLVLYIVSCVILLTGLYYMVFVFNKRQTNFFCVVVTSCIGITFLVFSLLGKGISGNELWGTSFFHQLISNALCIWVIAFLYQKKWAKAFAWCAVMAFFQLHVGIYCFVLCALWLLYEAIANRQFKIFKYLFIWLIPVVPFALLIMSSTSGSVFTNQEYVELYGRFRHPHHMIPSSWDSSEFVIYAIIIVLTVLLAKFVFHLAKKWIVIISSYAGLLAVGLFLNYLFTDIVPLALILKLQPAKMVSIMNLLVLAMLLIFALEAFKKKDWVFVLALFVIVLSSGTVDWLFVIEYACLFLIGMIPKGKVRDGVIGAGLIVYVIWNLWSGNFNLKYVGLLCLGLIIAWLCIHFHSASYQIIKSVVLLASTCVVAMGVVLITPNFMDNNIDQDLLYLAEYFKENTDDDEQFFADPDDTSLAAFTLFSERGTYAFYKNVPIIDEDILEWANRLEECGILIRDGDQYLKGTMNLTEEEQVQLCKEYGIHYMLIKGETDAFLETNEVEVTYSQGQYTLLRVVS